VERWLGVSWRFVTNLDKNNVYVVYKLEVMIKKNSVLKQE
jgi:hypothetical protein